MTKLPGASRNETQAIKSWLGRYQSDAEAIKARRILNAPAEAATAT